MSKSLEHFFWPYSWIKKLTGNQVGNEIVPADISEDEAEHFFSIFMNFNDWSKRRSRWVVLTLELSLKAVCDL